MTDDDRLRLGVAVLAGALAACLFYALDRTFAAVTGPPLDPRAIVTTTRVDYFWRAGLSAFVATLVGSGAWALGPKRAAHGLPWLRRAAPWVVAACASLSMNWP